MKLSFSILTVVLAAIAGISAQTPQAGEKVTVAGCLERAQRNGSLGGSAVGTTASPNTAADEANSATMVDAFLLLQATPVVGGVPEPTSAPDHSSANSPTGTSGRLPTSYGLIGREAELERHQGGRLQVSGTIASPSAGTEPDTAKGATATGIKRINVESFKVLSDRCPAR